MASPMVQTYMQFAATTLGRDKAYRFIQYFCRFLAYYTVKYGAPKSLVLPLVNIKASVGLTRKLMRVGKPIDFIHTALAMYKSTSDEVLRVLKTGKQIFMACYMATDTLQWIHGAQVYRFKNNPTLVRLGARLWLAAIACSWLAGVYELYQIHIRAAVIPPHLLVRGKKEKGQTSNVNEEAQREAQVLDDQCHKVTRQLIQDSLDILIPSHTLKYHSLGEGLVGLAGTITAFMGGEPHWKKLYTKNKPTA
ncbi:Peroxisomal membrane protein PMP27 [Dispira simplex]|nr:Peroxisomal membrane protein PMP27 [Dispira simplex]